ncbi:MAG: hypothetical protein KH431_03400 [Erysipelotrichaceae bacterium]|nr:hypothetical protein [Erysipelotrichaceae bacterium]
MFETAQKYTDMKYCRKEEVAQDFQMLMIDPIWIEIENYRRLFRWSVPFAKEYYITRNSCVNDRINELTDQLYGISFDHRNEHVVWECDTRILNERQQSTAHQFINQMQIALSGDKEMMLFRFLDQWGIDHSIQRKHFAFFLDDQISIILRIFVALEFFDKVTSYAFVLFLLGSHKMLYPLSFLSISELFDINISSPVEFDLTYKLLLFLDKLRLNLSKQVLSLGRNARDDVRILSKQELLQQYPMLSEHQAGFYVTHNQVDHYYTIRDYMTFAEVCYETARYSLEGIVKQNWYRKQRIGKKFMYYVV